MTNFQDQPDTVPSTSSPLRDKTILVTRSLDQTAEFSRLLRSLGATAISFPAIRILPPSSWEECDKAISVLETYDAFILTSANAALHFFQRLDQFKNGSALETLEGKPFYVVGSKTRDAVAKEGMLPVLLPDVSNAHQLAEALLRVPLGGKRLLILKGSLSGYELAGGLEGSGAHIDEAIVYQTVAPQEADTLPIRKKFEGRSIDVVTLFSPSSVRHLVAWIPVELLSTATIAVIGTRTAEAAREAGLPVHIISPRPTSPDMVDALVRHFNQGVNL